MGMWENVCWPGYSRRDASQVGIFLWISILNLSRLFWAAQVWRFLFCLIFSDSSLASTHSPTSPWHQVPDFYEPIEFCSTLVPTLGEGFIGILLGQWDGPCPNHAHIWSIECLIPMNNQGLVYFGSWILTCLLHEALPFMSNIFVVRDTAKSFSPRTILQHTAVSRPALQMYCIY